MKITYDMFTDGFLSKISEFEFIQMKDIDKTEIVDGYMKRAIAGFKKNCKYDLTTAADDVIRVFDIEINEEDVDELVEIISEGMLVQWLKPYTYRQELYEHAVNTRDFTGHSTAELLLRMSNRYKEAQDDYKRLIREYSYNHGSLKDLHI